MAMIAACEPPFEPIAQQERRVLVHAILDPSADRQQVLLEWTQASNLQIGIGDATVRITNPQGQIAMATIQPNVAPLGQPVEYVFFLSQTFQTLQRSGTYQLSITIPGQPIITGTTTIPDVAPTTVVNVRIPPFVRLRDTLRMNLPRVPGATGYRVLSTPHFAGQPMIAFPVVSVFTDTAVVLPGTLETIESEEQFFPAQMTVDVVALAVDDNYFTYFTTATDPFAGAPPSRLTGGAVGVFGSVVPLVRYRLTVQ
jgi:hypothetical protein